MESCNLKGIRERRLNENLRKIAERLKLKKMKKPKLDPQGSSSTIQPPSNGQQTLTSLLGPKPATKPAETADDGNTEMKEVGEAEEEKKEESGSESEKEGSEREKDRHCLFQNDDFYQSIMNAAWFGKKMPTKRQVMQEGKVIATRGRPAA